MQELNEKLRDELKKIFNNGEYSASEIMSKNIKEEDVNKLIDNLYLESANTIGNLKNEDEINKISKSKGIYFVCKNGIEVNEFYSPKDKVKKNSKGKDILWYKIDINEDMPGKTLNQCLVEIGETEILYIGKTKRELRTRIKEYIQYGDFENKKANRHAGGRAIWQISKEDDINNLVFCWIEIKEPEKAEKYLIENYKNQHNGQRPLANQKNGG